MSAGAVTIGSDDVALLVDPTRCRISGSRDIDGRKRAVAQQKTMRVEAAVNSVPDNVALPIDAKGIRQIGSRISMVVKVPLLSRKL